MNLYRIGNLVLNMDRVNGIVEQRAPVDASVPAGRTVLRVLFDNAHIDLTDQEAHIIRGWFRHTARNLAPHRDEDGEELIAPEEQVWRAFESLVGLIDHARPRDPVIRHAAHRVKNLLEHFLTGELQPARLKTFERAFEEVPPEAQRLPALSPDIPRTRD